MKKNKIERIKGYGKFKSKNEISVIDENGTEIDTIIADNIIIATGARPKSIPAIPGDHKNIITSAEAMTLSEQPKGNDYCRCRCNWY